MGTSDDVRTWADGDGTVLEYSDGGEGTPIVLIHAGGFADWFVPVAGILRQDGHRVVRLRRAGYGDAPAPPGLSVRDHAAHSAAVLDAVGVTGAHVVGHSSGAMVALDLAAARPDLVDRLTLYETAPGGRLAPAPPPGPAAGSSPPRAPDAPADPFDAFMTMACGPGYLRVLTEGLGAAGVERARHESAYFLTDELPAAFGWPFDDATAARITQPVTLAHGTQSSPSYRSACHQLQALLPQAEVIAVDGADHLYPLQDPAAFAALVTEQS
jgi:3-oxoadipate enol-lactonase